MVWGDGHDGGEDLELGQAGGQDRVARVLVSEWVERNGHNSPIYE